MNTYIHLRSQVSHHLGGIDYTLAGNPLFYCRSPAARVCLATSIRAKMIAPLRPSDCRSSPRYRHTDADCATRTSAQDMPLRKPKQHNLFRMYTCLFQLLECAL